MIVVIRDVLFEGRFARLTLSCKKNKTKEIKNYRLQGSITTVTQPVSPSNVVGQHNKNWGYYLRNYPHTQHINNYPRTQYILL